MDGGNRIAKRIEARDLAVGIRPFVLVRRGHMRKAAVEHDARQAVDQLRERHRFFLRPHADAAHAGIQLDVQLNLPMKLLACGAQRTNARLVKDHLRQAARGDRLRGGFLDAAEHKDRRVYSGLAQLCALLRDGDSEHIRAGLKRRARHLNRAVTIAVGLDHGKEFNPFRKACAHHAHIVADGGKIDLANIISKHTLPAFLLIVQFPDFDIVYRENRKKKRCGRLFPPPQA